MKYFTIKELIHSDTANKLQIDNSPSKEIERNLSILVDHLLDPIREQWGKPIMINSGYRCKELNKAIKGSNTSHHMSGYAADMTVGSISNNKELFNMIKDGDFQWTQLILENGGQWVHISYIHNNLKKQILYL